jgi:uncharacterized protein (TIGR00255 family)
MTGFGRGEAPIGDALVTAELRSVNSRHLDVRARLPRDAALLEPPVRAAVQRYFSRGQIDIQVKLPADVLGEPEVLVNEPAAKRYVEAARRLARELDLEPTLPLASLLELPGVIRLQDVPVSAERFEAPVVAAVEDACREAVAMRTREGEALGRDLLGRIARLEEVLVGVEARAEDVARGVRERLRRRLEQLAPELEIDPGRLDQEVIFYTDRMDVTEETVRFRSHLAQLRSTLQAKGPVGRRLEFLLQEVGREANTIGSKANDAPIGAEVVEIKAELEKLREQALNVE